MRAGKLLSAAAVAAVAAAAIPDQAWDYVDVRSGAHLFYWLYGSTGVPRASAPLVFWLQGGPGASSVGYGDFSEMGPLDINLQPRNTTWVQAANVVYIDNPVGTGYSYVDDLSLLTTNVTQIAADLVAFTAAFFEAYPELQANPFYIFSESYGGKMTVAFADALLTAIDNKVVTCNFRGIELGVSGDNGSGNSSGVVPAGSNQPPSPHIVVLLLLLLLVLPRCLATTCRTRGSRLSTTWTPGAPGCGCSQ